MIKLKNQIKTTLSELSEDYTDEEIGKVLEKLADTYLRRSRISKLPITDSIGMELDDFRALIEGNDVSPLLAVIQTLEGYYRIIHYYGDNPNIIIQSGTMDIAIVIEGVKSILKQFKKNNIDVFDMDLFCASENGLHNRFRNELKQVYAK